MLASTQDETPEPLLATEAQKKDDGDDSGPDAMTRASEAASVSSVASSRPSAKRPMRHKERKIQKTLEHVRKVKERLGLVFTEAVDRDTYVGQKRVAWQEATEAAEKDYEEMMRRIIWPADLTSFAQLQPEHSEAVEARMWVQKDVEWRGRIYVEHVCLCCHKTCKDDYQKEQHKGSDDIAATSSSMPCATCSWAAPDATRAFARLAGATCHRAVC